MKFRHPPSTSEPYAASTQELTKVMVGRDICCAGPQSRGVLLVFALDSDSIQGVALTANERDQVGVLTAMPADQGYIEQIDRVLAGEVDVGPMLNRRPTRTC